MLHEFSGGTADGANPYASLLLSDDVLYGTTQNGGANDTGTIFALDISQETPDFTLMHSFGGESSTDGRHPKATLLQLGDLLYGTTELGGVADLGSLFVIGLDGGDYTQIDDIESPESGFLGKSLAYHRGYVYLMSRGHTHQYDFGAVYKEETLENYFIDTGYEALGLNFSAEDIANLCDLYYAGKQGQSPDPVLADGRNWYYFDEEISGKEFGDSWEQDGIYYFYFGSGVKSGEGGGDVPEPSTLLLLLTLIGFGSRMRRNK